VYSSLPESKSETHVVQAEKASLNYIGVFKLSNINGKKREPIPASAVDGDTDVDSDSSSDEEDEEINEDTKPILHVRFYYRNHNSRLSHKKTYFSISASYVDVVMFSVAISECTS
jgi:hypothetical protein